MRVRALLLALLLASPAAAQDGADGIAKEFEKQFRRPEPERKAAAFRLLDPTSADSLPRLYDGFRVPHWLVRGAAAEVAARVTDGPLRAQLRLDLLRHEESAVRGGIAYALSLAPVRGDGEALAGALEDRAWPVRRDAARGIGRVPTREGVEALLRALGRETEPRVRVWVLDALRGLARNDPGPDLEDWQNWWKAHREDPEFRRMEESPDRKDLEGVPLDVVTVAARRGPGAPGRPAVFVLAPFGWTHDLWRPHLDALEDLFAVSYVRLPTLRELTGLSGYGGEIGVYPADRLARALEALRKDRGVKRVLVVADGPACWIAELYALAYPESTAGLVLVNGWLDAASYGAALERLATESRDPDERAAADSLRGLAPGARDEREDRWLGRVFLTQRLLDRADLLGHWFWSRAREPQGFAVVPPLRLDRRRRIEAPTLFVFPGASPLSGHPDAQRVRDAFPSGIVATLDDTKGFPFVDRHDEFHRVVRGFVDRFGLSR